MFAERLSSVNGKSVPIAHLRKGSGFPGHCIRPKELLPSFRSCKLYIQNKLTTIYPSPSGIQDARTRTRALVPTSRVHLVSQLLKENRRVETPSTRRSPRIQLQVPVFVRGTDAAGTEFIELTKTLNISATGAYIASAHVLRLDQILHLTIPAPSPTSSSLVPSETPPITAKVRRQYAVADICLSGLEFLKPLE
jgi:hypothetical protein